jgi:hypothetical protein
MAGSRPFFAVASTDANGRIHVITGTNDAAGAGNARADDSAHVDAHVNSDVSERSL